MRMILARLLLRIASWSIEASKRLRSPESKPEALSEVPVDPYRQEIRQATRTKFYVWCGSHRRVITASNFASAILVHAKSLPVDVEGDIHVSLRGFESPDLVFSTSNAREILKGEP